MKLSTRWTASPDSYSYHMSNKIKIVKAMSELFTGSSIGYRHLSGLVVKKEWEVPEEGDFPNYQFVYNLCQAYVEFSKTLVAPVAEGIVYENVVRYIASLAKQDHAYYTRFNGMMFRVLKDYERGSISKAGNLEYLKFLVRFWETFEGRERNYDLYVKFLQHIIQKYETEPFYTQSIDWVLNWIGEHKEQFVYADDMNPKRWYASAGIGFADNLTMGGRG